MQYRQTFTVEGVGKFPFDMLRYDTCWPSNETVSSELESNPMTNGEDHFTKVRSISLTRHVSSKQAKPTSGRWKSFGWQVLEDTIKTYI